MMRKLSESCLVFRELSSEYKIFRKKAENEIIKMHNVKEHLTKIYLNFLCFFVFNFYLSVSFPSHLWRHVNIQSGV